MPKRPIEPIVNGRIRLRLLEETDLPLTMAWRNQDHIRRWFFDSAVISEEQHLGWFAKYADRDDDFTFVIEELETLQRPVGQVAMYHIDRAAGTAEFGRLMIGDAEARGLGLARLATAGLADEARRLWNVTQVDLELRPDNVAATAVYRACGFAPLPQDGAVMRMRKSVR